MGGLEQAERGDSGEKLEQTVNQLKAKTAGKLSCCETGGSDSSGYWENLPPRPRPAFSPPSGLGCIGEKARGSVCSPVDCALWIPSASPSVSNQSSFLSHWLSQQPFIFFSPGWLLQTCSPHMQGTKHFQPTGSYWSGKKELLPLNKTDANANYDLKTVPSLRSWVSSL